jgi:NADPH-dependent 2,4-dienoyl-CoA reductase/sulfur reductase-like enzyme
MTTENVVIVGAGLSGLRTAERLRRRGHSGLITLVGGEEHPAYDRPPLSKALLVQKETPTPPSLRDPQAYAELDLDLRLGVHATRLDSAAREVHLDDGSVLGFDHLVIATGARARATSDWEQLPGVHTLRTFDDCLALRSQMEGARHLTVVGAGVLGCEIAAAGRTRGLEVCLVEPLETPLVRVLGAQLGSAVADLHRDRGVDLRTGRSVTSVESGAPGSPAEQAPSGIRIRLDDGSTIDTDVVVLAIGSVPETSWLEGSGVEVADGIVCDPTGATSVPGVWAVGDVARLAHGPGGLPVRLEHWTSAGDTAALVAANIATPDAPTTLSEVPYFWSDQYDVKVQALGVPHPDDEVTVVAGSVEEHSFLALLHRGGTVRAAVAMSMPAPLARCRRLVAGATDLQEALDLAPWAPRKQVSA